MLSLSKLVAAFVSAGLVIAQTTTLSSPFPQGSTPAEVVVLLRPHLQVPTLTQIRDILALLEAPILATIVSRAALPASPSLYTDNGEALLDFLGPLEETAAQTGRYNYGTLEYPYTRSPQLPDETTPSNPFPGGRFHQDTFTPNANLTLFYIQTLVPLLEAANEAIGSTSVFFHLTNSTDSTDINAKYTLDAELLALLSHRSSIGKIVAESKYAAAIDQFTPLIQTKNSDEIRVLLTNTTQETQVLDQAASASFALASAWETAQGATSDTTSAFVTAIQNAAAKVFRELIDITTEVEIEYILARLN